ncbi:MAG: hypothetical protein GYB64_04025 [Chloroflexi bacterium]|nr:hypothetical protein [Chloroflexota bacterium]
MAVLCEVFDRDIHVYRFVAPWTWDDYLPVAQEMQELASADPFLAEHGVVVIADFTQGYPLPKRIVTYFPQVIDQASQVKIRRVIVLQTDGPGGAMLGIFEKLWGKVEVVESLEIALATARESAPQEGD